MAKHLNISGPRIILIVTAIAVGYFIVTGALQAIRSHRLAENERQLQSDIQGLQGRYERLQALHEYLDTDEYIETMARTQLGLVREGETSIIALSTVPSPTPKPDGNGREDGGPPLWWEILIR
ncbi:MAG: septum formation initiator family protein [Chloroflexi bacterium]|nr:septum formation initiator family protein [Chloroflexota bacterium]